MGVMSEVQDRVQVRIQTSKAADNAALVNTRGWMASKLPRGICSTTMDPPAHMHCCQAVTACCSPCHCVGTNDLQTTWDALSQPCQQARLPCRHVLLLQNPWLLHG